MNISKKILLFSISIVLLNSICLGNDNWHFKPSDVNVLHSEPANQRIFYAKDSLQFGDLYLPTKKSYPVIIIIHGGCWLSNFADLKNTAALSDALRDMGYAVWNIEYRRIDNSGGGWPGTFKDIGNAADFLKNISAIYSLDLNQVVVIGQSAGGHLALWLAGRHNLSKTSVLYVQNPLRLKGVISMGGVPDLKAFQKQGAAICGQNIVSLLIGDKERYQDTSPIELLPLKIPQILIYGQEDPAVPSSYSKNYIKKALQKG